MLLPGDWTPGRCCAQRPSPRARPAAIRWRSALVPPARMRRCAAACAEIPGRGLMRGGARLGSAGLLRPARRPGAGMTLWFRAGAARRRSPSASPTGCAADAGRARRGAAARSASTPSCSRAMPPARSWPRPPRRHGHCGLARRARPAGKARADRGAARRRAPPADGGRRHQRRGGAGAGACLGQPRRRARTWRRRPPTSCCGARRLAALPAAIAHRAPGAAPGAAEHRLLAWPTTWWRCRWRCSGLVTPLHRRAGDGLVLADRDPECAARREGDRPDGHAWCCWCRWRCCMGLLGLVAFLWNLRSGQYEDLDGAASRILFDDQPRHASKPTSKKESSP